jgi:hypothetical protein
MLAVILCQYQVLNAKNGARILWEISQAWQKFRTWHSQRKRKLITLLKTIVHADVYVCGNVRQRHALHKIASTNITLHFKVTFNLMKSLL